MENKQIGIAITYDVYHAQVIKNVYEKCNTTVCVCMCICEREGGGWDSYLSGTGGTASSNTAYV